MLFFVEEGKPENPGKNPLSKDENQQQTQPTYDAESGNRTQATLVGGECSHHCAIPAPHQRCWLRSNIAGKLCQHLHGDGGYEAKPSSIVSLSVIVSSGWCLPFWKFVFLFPFRGQKKVSLGALTSPKFPKEALS